MAKIIYCGHSTVIIKTFHKTILIDPFLSGNPRCPEHLKDPGKIDYICLTHGHADHVGDTIALAKKHRAIVFATWELACLINKEGVPAAQIQYMNLGGRVEVEGMAVNLTPALHSSSYDASDGNTYYAGDPAGVVVELDEKKNIYHLGDTALFSDMQLIGARFQPTLALLPIGDRFTMGPQDAAKALELIKPKLAVPVHYATFPPLSGTPEEFIEAAGGTSLWGGATRISVLQPGEEIAV